MNFFVDGTGRFAKEEMIGENAFRWPILGRLNRPSTCTGVNAGNGAGLTQFSVEFEENFLNPYDIVRFADGNQAIVMGEPTASANGYTFQFLLLLLLLVQLLIQLVLLSLKVLIEVMKITFIQIGTLTT